MWQNELVNIAVKKIKLLEFDSELVEINYLLVFNIIKWSFHIHLVALKYLIAFQKDQTNYNSENFY